MFKRFADLILSSARKGYSDLHLCGNQPVVYRKDGQISFSSEARWTHRDVDALCHDMLNFRQKEVLQRRWSVDFALSIGNIRVRINIFNTVSGASIAVRLLPGTIPTIEHLNLHPSLKSISALKSGLVLVCGTTGCGKTTTIASLIAEINAKRPAHIITLEDPVEYRIPSLKSFVEQREVGTHVPSVERGLIDVMREDPDIIMVGELREPETIRLTLNAAESGHLVIATLHATNVEDALYRIINSVTPDAEEYIRYQLASTISWVILQKLVYSELVRFRIPLLAVMRGTSQIKGIIREKKLHQIENAMHTGKAEGMFTQERYLKEVIETDRNLVNPYLNFRPSAEVVADDVPVSSLFDTDGCSDVPLWTPATVQEKTPPRKMEGTGKFVGVSLHDTDDAHYVITDSDDLSEIIAQTENTLSNKK